MIILEVPEKKEANQYKLFNPRTNSDIGDKSGYSDDKSIRDVEAGAT